MMRRAVLLLAALLALAAVAATPASAQSSGPGQGADDDYTSACSGLLLSKTSVEPNEVITVSGTAAIGSEDVLIVLDDSTTLATTTAAPFTHAFSTTVTIPGTIARGVAHSIRAFQAGEAACSNQIASVNVLALTIQAPPQQPPAGAEPLARTGSNSTLPLIRFGFGLLAAGGMAIVVSRRRRASVSTSA
jgi:hypothetical protein